MKYIFFLLFPSLLIAQTRVDEFAITPEGVNQYVVIETSASSQELYEKSKKWIHHNFSNPEKVMPRDIPNELIGGQMFFQSVLEVKNGPKTIYFDCIFSYEINFKDNRLRLVINNLSFPGGIDETSPFADSFDFTGGALAWSFYNSRGEPKKRSAKQFDQANNFLNLLVAGLSDYIHDLNIKNDW